MEDTAATHDITVHAIITDVWTYFLMHRATASHESAKDALDLVSYCTRHYETLQDCKSSLLNAFDWKERVLRRFEQDMQSDDADSSDLIH